MPRLTDFLSTSRRETLAVPLLAGMVFLGAFLLFTMEPLVGRLLAPFFGGAVHIWLLCLVFFQLMLLAGYLYAHLWAKRAGAWHLLLLFLPLVSLPLEISATPAANAPIGALLQALISRVALPFAVLSTTVVVAQVWLTRSDLGGRRNPYPLYGASNAGSLLGLLSYPLVIEPLAGLRLQSRLWLAAYLAYAALAVLAFALLRPEPETRQEGGAEETPPLRSHALWGVLSALTSAFLITVTNVIAMEVGSLPMVWIPPLVLYLLSFVLTFREKASLSGRMMSFWPEVLLMGGILYVLSSNHLLFIGGHLLVLFTLCLFVHDELYRSRPDRHHLTGFYLAIAAGGFTGGAAVTLGAPLVFSGLYEYPLVLLAIGAILAWRSRLTLTLLWKRSPAFARLARIVLLAVLAFSLVHFDSRSLTKSARLVHRNHYGITHIVDAPPTAEAPAGVRMLIHSSTLHGMQYLDDPRRRLPTLYYYPAAGLADVFALLPTPRRISAVGLGAGIIGAYTKGKDRLTYYEIDPDMEGMARGEFTYLGDTAAEVRVVIGDGRLTIREGGVPDIPDDLVFIDAFSGDGIPTHLLTQEAFRLYLGRLRDKGILLFHLSNRHYDLHPVARATALSLGLHGAFRLRSFGEAETYFSVNTVYAAFSRDADTMKALAARGWIPLGNRDGLPEVRAWTDDYVNILAPLACKILPGNARAPGASAPP